MYDFSFCCIFVESYKITIIFSGKSYFNIAFIDFTRKKKLKLKEKRKKLAYLQVVELVKKRYGENETDEFLKPIILQGEAGRVHDGDTMVFFDYRADRMREITEV